MKARDLISGLEALCAPEAEVYFVLDDAEVFQVNGGLDLYLSALGEI